MKSFAFLALSAVAFAAPLLEKRDVVYETVVEEVFETVYTTTTVYVEPSDVPSSVVGAFYENNPAAAVSTPATSTTTPAPAYSAPPAAAPKVEAPPAAVAAPSAAPYVAPPAVAAPEVKPTTSVAPAAAPAYVAPPAASTPAASTPSYSSPSSGSGSGSGDHVGDMTYYDVEVGLGSCGTTATNSENVVALSHLDMNNGANPNANPLCGKTINIYSDTGVHQAKVFDTCPACAKGSLDLPEPLFKLIAPAGDGRVKGVSWSFA